MMNTKFLFTSVALLVCVLVTGAGATPKSPATVPPFPGTLVNARYVYVTSYDGDQFDPNLLSEDRRAINDVQTALQNMGKLIVVYQPQQADMVVMVTSRPSEDILAVYDAHGWPGNQYLWRMTGRNGLQSGETPLVTSLEKAFEQAVKKHSQD